MTRKQDRTLAQHVIENAGHEAAEEHRQSHADDDDDRAEQAAGAVPEDTLYKKAHHQLVLPVNASVGFILAILREGK